MQNPFHTTPGAPQPPRLFSAKRDKQPQFDADGNIYEILLMFYEPQADDHYFNHLVSNFSGRYSHVEICFPTYTNRQENAYDTTQCTRGDTKVLFGSSIFQNGTVFFKRKEYSRDGYTSIGIRIDRGCHDALVRFCQEAATRAVAFDAPGMARACLPFVLMPHDPDKTFCSKYVADALQYAGVQGVGTRRLLQSVLQPPFPPPPHTHALTLAKPR
eukprot:3932837-Rhodomonas_salina.1